MIVPPGDFEKVRGRYYFVNIEERKIDIAFLHIWCIILLTGAPAPLVEV